MGASMQSLNLLRATTWSKYGVLQRCPNCKSADHLFLRGKGMHGGKLMECLDCKKTFEVKNGKV